ncbi:MAG: glucan biosynthesis protein G [Alphaproteobacteria bacterium]|nr:glucan biosynthesis protein G [Alphaproteobacteria bacterium]
MRKILCLFLCLIFFFTLFFFAYQHFIKGKIEVADFENISQNETFDRELLVKKAEELSKLPYKKAEDKLPQELKALSYDQHRDIRFSRENGPWYAQSLPFEVQFFHLGSIFQNSVKINEIINGKSTPIKYSPKFFDYGKNNLNEIDENLGYAGFRIHTPLNTKKYYDELVSFLGASYFRALGKGQKYGLSARGLAIDTALPTGEEFPVFEEFWLEKPNNKSKSLKVHAFLDSPSVTGIYSFNIFPGTITKMKVEATLFPRKNIAQIGIAPLTSMFLFGENNKHLFDDHRPEVHDSDGLLVHNGKGEWLWRPLDNSKYLRISSFVDENPKGFGIMQRDKDPKHYLDFEATYEQRPSAWIVPAEDWGKGRVMLVEIPSIQEIHDNIVAFWVPDERIEAGKKYDFKYSIDWCNDVSSKQSLAKIQATYTGIGGVSGMMETDKRKFVLDFVGKISQKDVEDGTLKLDVSTSEGEIIGTHLIYNPLIKGATAYVDFRPNNKTSEIRISLRKNDEIASETWSYQWLP